VNLWARICVACQRAKVHRHVKSPLQTFKVPPRRFQHINVDLVGPLPVSQGHTMLLTIVDRFTRWPEAIPMPVSTSAASCARALVAHWISRFGVPQHITSDRGAQFTSELWKEVARLLGTTLHHTTSFHPQANGLVERFHRHMKSALRARLNGPNWMDELPWVMLGIRTAPKEDLGASSAELVYGSPLTVPGDFLDNSPHITTKTWLPKLRETVRAFIPVATSHHGKVKKSIPSVIHNSKYVFVRRGQKTSLQTPYEGPFLVLTHGEKHFTLDVGGRREKISIDRLKPAHMDFSEPIQAALPPRRGRPPKQ